MRRFSLFIVSLLFYLLPPFGEGWGGVCAQVNTDRMMDIGRNALYFDDYALSIRYFNQVIAAKPYLHEPYFYRALAKFYLEDYTGAERDCSEAIRINPYYPNTYEVRGLSRINLRKFADAATDYAMATEVQPQNKAAWHNWVLCNIELDSLTRADSIASAIIHKWPRHADGYVMKSQISLAQKDTVGAEVWIDSALVSDRYHVPALSLKSSLLMHHERWADADTTLSEAIRLQPKNVQNHVMRALSRYHQRNLRGAMADYDMAIDMDPTNFAAHYNRGLLRAQVGEDNAAIEDFDFILRIDPDDVMALYNRAELLMETGDYRGAIRDYTALIKTYPNFHQGYLRRAQARRSIGDVRGAQRDEEHVLREQVAHRYGYASKASRTASTRKKSEINLDEYQKLVVEDEEEKHYESEYRGKIQNRDSELALLPPLSVPDYMLLTVRNDTARAAFTTGLEHLLTEEFEPAIRAFTFVVERAPNLAEAYYNRAYAYARTHRYDLAMADLTEAIRLRPRFSQALFNRGIVLIFKGNNADAIPDLSQAGELGIYQAYSIIKHNTPHKR
jgi:tetratricopeptide (TPR) repeat protein